MTRDEPLGVAARRKLARTAPAQAMGMTMADGGSHFEMKAHEQTYSSFIGLLKYGAVACFVIAFIVVYLIAS
jgi:hypothetical protein